MLFLKFCHVMSFDDVFDGSISTYFYFVNFIILTLLTQVVVVESEKNLITEGDKFSFGTLVLTKDDEVLYLKLSDSFVVISVSLVNII